MSSRLSQLEVNELKATLADERRIREEMEAKMQTQADLREEMEARIQMQAKIQAEIQKQIVELDKSSYPKTHRPSFFLYDVWTLFYVWRMCNQHFYIRVLLGFMNV